jgi:hypothetical protein
MTFSPLVHHTGIVAVRKDERPATGGPFRCVNCLQQDDQQDDDDDQRSDADVHAAPSVSMDGLYPLSRRRTRPEPASNQ